MYILKLQTNEMQLIQAVLSSANLNMEQSNLRGQLWQSMQLQLQEQVPKATPVVEEPPKED